MEIWREVPGSGGDYKIDISTREGRCWSEKRHRFLSNKPNKEGRINWSLTINGKPIRRQAACWIAWTFPELVQGAYFEGAVIDHIDTNPANNDPENLRWCTPKENSNNPLTKVHYSEAKKGRRLTEEHKRKLSEAGKGKHLNREDQSNPVNQYDLDWNYIDTYPSQGEAERQTGANHAHISACCLGKRKTTGGFRWSYEKREAS